MDSAEFEEALKNDGNTNLRFKISLMNQNLTAAPRANLNGKVNTKATDESTHSTFRSSMFSFAYTEISPEATLEPHWIDNADELIYVLEGDNIEVTRSSNGKRECKDVFTIKEGYFAMSEIGNTWTMINKNQNITAKLFRIFNSKAPSMTTLYDAFYSLPEDVIKTMLREKYYDQYEYF